VGELARVRRETSEKIVFLEESVENLNDRLSEKSVVDLNSALEIKTTEEQQAKTIAELEAELSAVKDERDNFEKELRKWQEDPDALVSYKPENQTINVPVMSMKELYLSFCKEQGLAINRRPWEIGVGTVLEGLFNISRYDKYIHKLDASKYHPIWSKIKGKRTKFEIQKVLDDNEEELGLRGKYLDLDTSCRLVVPDTFVNEAAIDRFSILLSRGTLSNRAFGLLL